MSDCASSRKGFCMFSITGHNVDFDLIKSNILIKPTKEVREGQIARIGREPYKYDVLIYRLDYGNGTSLIDALQQLLSLLYPYRSFITDISTKHDVRIEIVVHQSDFTLPSQILKELSDLNIELDFAVLVYD